MLGIPDRYQTTNSMKKIPISHRHIGHLERQHVKFVAAVIEWKHSTTMAVQFLASILKVKGLNQF